MSCLLVLPAAHAPGSGDIMLESLCTWAISLAIFCILHKAWQLDRHRGDFDSAPHRPTYCFLRPITGTVGTILTTCRHIEESIMMIHCFWVAYRRDVYRGQVLWSIRKTLGPPHFVPPYIHFEPNVPRSVYSFPFLLPLVLLDHPWYSSTQA